MQEQAQSIAILLVLFGLPLATWAHVSLMLEHERKIKQCGECSTCKAKEAERIRIAKENAARSIRVCVRGHGALNDDGVCNSCGWS